MAALALALSACGGGDDKKSDGGGGAAGDAAAAKGPITIWYSNNPEEVAWNKGVVAAWNKAHPDQTVTGQEIPAGKSSEDVITAAIAAGNAPCLIFNTAPAAVSGFQKQGGLVPLSDFADGASYIEARTGAERAAQYKSTDGKYYQMPWKMNPVMIFYNKAAFTKAGLDAENPPLKTYAEFQATSQTLVDKGGVQAAIWPSPSAEFYQPWFDFYPLMIAQSKGKQLVVDGEPQFTSPEGLAAAEFWKGMYDKGLSPKEAYKGDAFAEGKSAMSIVGPWAIAAYGEKIKWGVAPVPTKDGLAPEEVYTFSDEKSSAMYASCKNRGTAWEYLKSSTSKESDGSLLDLTGQMPMRTDVTGSFPEFFTKKPDFKAFAEQADRTVEVPNVPNSVEMWQEFRAAYSRSVIFGQKPVEEEFTAVAEKIKGLVKA